MAKRKSEKPAELWVGSVNDVPLVGTSKEMVNGVIALFKGDRAAADANGFKNFVGGVASLNPGSHIRTHGRLNIKDGGAKMSKAIEDLILQAVKPGAQSTIRVAQVAKTAGELQKNLQASFESLRKKLWEKGIHVERDGLQPGRSQRGEHVFNNALLSLYSSVIETFTQHHVPGINVVTLVNRMPPNGRVRDAFQVGTQEAGTHVNLTADQRANIRNWVAHIPLDLMYIPLNNMLFAYMTNSIRVNAVEYMNLHRLARNTQNLRADLNRTIDLMNTHRVYIDPIPAQQWMAENPPLLPRFYETEDAVQLMLRHLDPNRTNTLDGWVEEMRQAGITFH